MVELKISSAESLSDQGSKLPVLYLVLDEFHEDLVVKAVKAFGDVSLEVIRCRSKLSFHLPDGSVTTPLGTETVAVRRESGFKDDFQDHPDHFLDNFVPRGSHS